MRTAQVLPNGEFASANFGLCRRGTVDAMRIAILGTRGVPAAYGGFETLAWELSTRLAERGHDITVYCRRRRTDESTDVPNGVKRRFVPYLPGKYLETVSH